MSDSAATFLDEVRSAFRAQKAMGERAMAQLENEDLHLRLDQEANSIAVIVKHLWGNMLSRWTDFLDSDGEKASRQRDAEFDEQEADRDQVMAWWEQGWAAAFGALDALGEDDLERTVTIRGERHSVPRALVRQLTHYANHVGQIVLLAKHARGEAWETLSIPRKRG